MVPTHPFIDSYWNAAVALKEALFLYTIGNTLKGPFYGKF